MHTHGCNKPYGHQVSAAARIVQALKEAWEEANPKDELKLDLEGPAKHFWAGTEAGMLGVYSFKGVQAGGDGSVHQGCMSAGVWCRHLIDQMWSLRVGRDMEGSNSKRAELAALASVLCTKQFFKM